MKNIVICLFLALLVGCGSSRARIRDNAVELNKDLTQSQDYQLAIQESGSIIKDQLPLLASQVDDEEGRSSVKTIGDEADRAIVAAKKTHVLLDDGVDMSSEIISETDNVKDKEWGLLKMLKKYLFWFIILAVLIVFGPYLWPLIINSFISLASAVGFGISRTKQETAQLMYSARDPESEIDINQLITRFRATPSGEAAWRRTKKQQEKAKKKAAQESDEESPQ